MGHSRPIKVIQGSQRPEQGAGKGARACRNFKAWGGVFKGTGAMKRESLEYKALEGHWRGRVWRMKGCGEAVVEGDRFKVGDGRKG